MTWDHTQLYYCHLDISESAIKVASQSLLAGVDKTHEESTNQPRFAADGTLYFVNDKTGFWNLYSYKVGGEIALVLDEPKKASSKVTFFFVDHMCFVLKMRNMTESNCFVAGLDPCWRFAQLDHTTL